MPGESRADNSALIPGVYFESKFDVPQSGCYHQTAGWSSLVARWAHNPKVGGSNPPPATKSVNDLWAPNIGRFLFLSAFLPKIAPGISTSSRRARIALFRSIEGRAN
jgi:hypothetical protein